MWEKSSGDVPLGGAASHVGIYWGEGNGEDLMFHATPPACTIGPIKGKVVGDLYYASVAVSHGFDLTVDKSAGDAIALDTEGNGAYAASLEGARYGVYGRRGLHRGGGGHHRGRERLGLHRHGRGGSTPAPTG